MKNKSGMVFIVGGLLLIAAAFILTGYNLWDESRAKRETGALVIQLQDEILAIQAVNEAKNDSADVMVQEEEEPEVTLQIPELPAYMLNPDMEMPVETIDDRDYIGVLEIPSLELVLPTISEWSYPALKVAPCRYEGSAYKNNLIIAAHNYRSHFGLLENIAEREKVSFTDMDGNVFQYEVAFTEVLMPTAIEEMVSGEWDLTLFTCTLGGQYRVVVRCEKIGEIDA